jgi:quinol monooxygenase YgiN
VATTVILEVPVQPGKADDMISAFDEILPDTRSFKGCQGVTVHRDAADPNTLVLIEHWDSAEDHAAYGEWRKNSGTLGPLMALAAGRPVNRILSDIG